MHQHYERLPELGQAARAVAAPYSAENWARRFEDMAQRLRQMPLRR
jgi:hypothetical protein